MEPSQHLSCRVCLHDRAASSPSPAHPLKSPRAVPSKPQSGLAFVGIRSGGSVSLGTPRRGHHVLTPAPPTTLGVPGALSHSLPFLGSVPLSSLRGAQPHLLDFTAARGCLQALQSPRRAWLPAGATVNQHKQLSSLLVLPSSRDKTNIHKQRPQLNMSPPPSFSLLPSPCFARP